MSPLFCLLPVRGVQSAPSSTLTYGEGWGWVRVLLIDMGEPEHPEEEEMDPELGFSPPDTARSALSLQSTDSVTQVGVPFLFSEFAGGFRGNSTLSV